MDAGCLGNRVSLQVPATIVAGQTVTQGKAVSLSRALKESSTQICAKEKCSFDFPEFKECCIYV